MGTVEPRVVRVRGAEVVVRAAGVEDSEGIVAHRRREVVSTPHIISELEDVPDVEKQRALIVEHAEHPGWLLLVAVMEGESAGGQGGVVGFLSFRCGSRRKIAHQGTFGIGVDPEWRGRGVGSAMMMVLLDWAAAHPVIEKVSLGVFENNARARRLYERMGFVEEGRQLRFVREGPGRYVDDVMMCLFVKEGVAPEGFGVWTSTMNDERRAGTGNAE